MNSEIGDSVLEEIGFFVQSPSRLRILELSYAGDLTMDDVQNRLDISHSTAQRNLRDLVARQYIKENSKQSTYSLSVSGEVVYLYLRDLCGFIESVINLREFCRYFPKPIPLSPNHLPEITISTANSDHPFQPTHLLSELLETRSNVCLFNPVCNPTYLDQLTTRFHDPDVKTEVILTADTVSRFRDWCSVSLSEFDNDQTTRILVAESLPRFGIGLVDRTAVLISYTPNQRTHSLLEIENNTIELYNWVFEEYASQRNCVDSSVVHDESVSLR